MFGAFFGNLAFDTLHGTPFPVFLLFHLANASQALLGAWLAQRAIRPHPHLGHVPAFFLLVGLVVLVANALGALIGTGALLFFGYSQSFAESFRVWWGSCALATLVVLPTALAWLNHASPAQSRIWQRRGWEFLVICGCILAACWHLLVTGDGILGPNSVVILPLLLWSGVRFGPRGAANASLLLSLTMAYLTVHFHVGLSEEAFADGRYLFTLQAFLTISTLVALLPAIALAERDASLSHLQDSEERYRGLVNAALEGIGISENGKLLDANDQLLTMFGYERTRTPRALERSAPARLGRRD